MSQETAESLLDILGDTLASVSGTRLVTDEMRRDIVGRIKALMGVIVEIDELYFMREYSRIKKDSGHLKYVLPRASDVVREKLMRMVVSYKVNDQYSPDKTGEDNPAIIVDIDEKDVILDPENHQHRGLTRYERKYKLQHFSYGSFWKKIMNGTIHVIAEPRDVNPETVMHIPGPDVFRIHGNPKDMKKAIAELSKEHSSMELYEILARVMREFGFTPGMDETLESQKTLVIEILRQRLKMPKSFPYPS